LSTPRKIAAFIEKYYEQKVEKCRNRRLEYAFEGPNRPARGGASRFSMFSTISQRTWDESHTSGKAGREQ